MLTRSWKIAGALLPCAAMLGPSVGCSSSTSGPARMTESRREVPVVVARYETREVDTRDAYRVDRTAATAESRSSTGVVSSTDGRDDGNDRGSTATTETGAIGAAEQHDRVTMVASNPPPLTQMETPSHQPRDGEFWVAGLWRGESGQYVWQPGHMERDRTGQLYIAAYWAPSPRGWEYTPEYWR